MSRRRHHTSLGANSLRGGRNTYSAATLGGNYVEARNDPKYFRKVGKAASDPQWQSTTHLAQREASETKFPLYGGGIPEEKSSKINYDNVINFDNDAGEWKSVSASTYGRKKPTEFSTVYKEKKRQTKDQLNKYRGRWTRETDVMRKARYRTEQTIMMNRAVPSTFTTEVLSTLPGEPKVVEDVRNMILARQTDGHLGIRDLARMLKIFDDSGDKQLSRDELKWGLMDFGIELSPQQHDELFSAFDRDKSGQVDFDEFLTVLRGPMSIRRLNLVGQAFNVLDASGDGQITIEDIEDKYDASKHPDVLSGKKSEREALIDFMNQWEGFGGDSDGIVTKEEFANYYRDISASIDDDDYFELMIRNAWNLKGGEGWCESTTIPKDSDSK
eukprot:g4880.t1